MWLLVLFALLIGLSSPQPPPAPPVPPAPKVESIPYCPTRTFGQPQTYYPCMYSSREFSA